MSGSQPECRTVDSRSGAVIHERKGEGPVPVAVPGKWIQSLLHWLSMTLKVLLVMSIRANIMTNLRLVSHL